MGADGDRNWPTWEARLVGRGGWMIYGQVGTLVGGWMDKSMVKCLKEEQLDKWMEINSC